MPSQFEEVAKNVDTKCLPFINYLKYEQTVLFDELFDAEHNSIHSQTAISFYQSFLEANQTVIS